MPHPREVSVSYTRKALVFSLLSPPLSGCFLDYTVGEPGKPPGSEPLEIDCPIWTCVEYIVIAEDNLDELATCYGWVHPEGEGEGSWTESPPPGVERCDPETSGDCTVQVHVDLSASGLTDDCPTGCMEGSPGDPVPDECCYVAVEEEDMEDALGEDWAYGADVIELLDEDCNVTATKYIECELEVEEEPELSATECPSTSVAQMPAADHIVEVDEAGSYLTVHSSGSQDTVPLSGVGAVGAGPAEFLSAIVDTTETMDLGNDDWHDWRLWFTADIAMNISSGSFTVPYAQGYQIKARGQVNGTKLPAAFEPLANATGQFNNSTGTWYLNYSSTFPGGWVQIHLEGPFYGTSSP
jgi:hypothetical protein